MPSPTAALMPSSTAALMPSLAAPLMSSLTAGKIFAWLIFGLIGMAAFGYGKKQMHLKILIIGCLLMVYPYFIDNTIALWVVGGALTGSLYLFRER